MDTEDGAVVMAGIDHIVRDTRHEDEKPYEMRYDTDGVIPRTNTEARSCTIAIRNFRPYQTPQSFQEYGFSVENMGTTITEAVFSNRASIHGVYYPVVEKLLWQKFLGAKQVRVVEHNLRRRHADFPAVDDNLDLKFSQPAPRAHLDYSMDSATRNACAILAERPDEVKRVIAVNFWKSFTPGNDWPLALCDSRTLNHDTDIAKVDIVYHNRVTENEHVYHSPEHQWYYVKDLLEDEIIMFVQKDSLRDGGGGVAHASFRNPMSAKNAPPRTSIEFRAYVIY